MRRRISGARKALTRASNTAYSDGFASSPASTSSATSTVVAASEVAAPTETSPEFWLVADHSAEKYESMLLTVQNVQVTQLDLGKAADNYNLHAAVSDVWASDYMNVDAEGLYHPLVGLGNTFQSVAGIIEERHIAQHGDTACPP